MTLIGNILSLNSFQLTIKINTSYVKIGYKKKLLFKYCENKKTDFKII